ncbi:MULTISPECIES: hypothetical protein [unclassified Streptomyces]
MLSADGHYVSVLYPQLAGGKLAYTTRATDTDSAPPQGRASPAPR